MPSPFWGFAFDLAWQTSALLGLGLLVSIWFRRRPAHAHVALGLAIALATTAPLVSGVVHELGWGYLSPVIAADDSTTVGDQPPSGTGFPLELSRVIEPSWTGLSEDVSLSAQGPPGVSVPTATREMSARSQPSADGMDTPWLQRLFFVVLALWIVASLVLSARLFIGGWRSSRVVRRASPVPSGPVLDAYSRVAAEHSPRRAPALLQSTEIYCPVLWAWGTSAAPHGAILIPEGSDSSRDIDWEAVFVHEITHSMRGDGRTQLVASLLVCLVPWQPLAWWARRRLVWLAELACDGGVLMAGSARSSYAESLLAFVPSRRTSWVTAATTRGGALKKRIARILTDATPAPATADAQWMRWAVGAGVALAVVVACAQPGSHTMPPEPVASKSGESSKSLDALSGVVVDESGEPVESVVVTLVREYVEDPRAPVQGHLDRNLQQTRTDALGRFRLDALRPGWVTLMLDHPSYARTFSPGDPRLKTGSHDVRLVIPRGLTLRGRVTAEGRALAHLPLRVSAPNLSSRPLGEWEVETDGEGVFEVVGVSTFISRRAETGFPIVSVSADGEDWVSARYAIYDEGGATLPFVDIEAVPRRDDAEAEVGTVDVNRPTTGTVARLAGEPTGTASILVSLAVPNRVNGRLRSIHLMSSDESFHRFREVGEDGTLLFDQLPAGRYSIWLPNTVQPNVAGVRVDLEEGTHRAITIEPGPVTIHGTVRCGGVPVRAGVIDVNAWQLDTRNGFEQGYGVVHEDGTWEAAGLQPGVYRITFDGGRGHSVPNHFVVDAYDDTKFDIDLPTSRIDFTIEGREIEPLLDRDGGDMAFSMSHVVHVQAGGNEPMGGNTGGNVDISDGLGFVEHLPAGPWTLSVRGDDGHSRIAKVVLDDDAAVATARLERSDAGTGVVRGAVRRGGGAEAADSVVAPMAVTAYAYEPFGFDVSADYGDSTFSPVGYAIAGLPSGTYGLLFRPASYGLRRLEGDVRVPFFFMPDVRVGVGESILRDVTIPPARSVQLEVLDSSGKPTHRATWKLSLHGKQAKSEFLPFQVFVGSSPRALTAIGSPFPLPIGEHMLEVTRRGEQPELHTLIVAPGEGVQTIKVPTISERPK